MKINPQIAQIFIRENPPNPPNPRSIFTAVVMKGYTPNNENQSADYADCADLNPHPSAPIRVIRGLF
jgi:hypothetical protein